MSKSKVDKQKNTNDTQSDNSVRNEVEKNQYKDKINLDYDWNTEYGDGDIPDIDK